MVLQKSFLIIGSLLAFLAVTIGAFGAHALKERLSMEMQAIFEVGVRYHMYHALAIMIVAFAIGNYQSSLLPISGWLFLSGTIIFSGSLYLLALTGIRALGAITPVGGILFLLGWLFLAIGIFKSQS